MENELKPCPFCGHKPLLKSDNRYPRPECERITAYEVICTNMDCIIYGADNVYFTTPSAAVDAEEQGLLVRLPCKVGDMVYYIDGGKSYKAKAVAFRITESGLRVYCERNFMGHIGFEGVYGITVFLAREEAEAALKEETT